jgi:hypothetical protein
MARGGRRGAVAPRRAAAARRRRARCLCWRASVLVHCLHPTWLAAPGLRAAQLYARFRVPARCHTAAAARPLPPRLQARAPRAPTPAARAARARPRTSACASPGTAAMTVRRGRCVRGPRGRSACAIRHASSSSSPLAPNPLPRAACSQCPHYRTWVDSPRGDLNHDGRLNYGVSVADPASNDPAGEPEVFPPVEGSAGAAGDPLTATEGEAHYPLECSARGLCDRDKGVCSCFPGYEGAGCQRGACGACAAARRRRAAPRSARTPLRARRHRRAALPLAAPPPTLQRRAPAAAPATARAARCARWRRLS